MATRIQLIRSGGLMGKIMKAQTEMNLTEQDLEELIGQLGSEKNKNARDAFHHTLIIGTKKFAFDPEKIKGKFRKMIRELEDNLKP